MEDESRPRPPASETADTSGALDIHCIQPCTIGYWILSFSVTAVFICLFIFVSPLFLLVQFFGNGCNGLLEAADYTIVALFEYGCILILVNGNYRPR